jgi:hypothetical protein
MIGKITINPSQLKPDYIYFVKTYTTIKIIYKHPLCTISPITVIIPINRSINRYYTRSIPKGLISQIVQMEHLILCKWKTTKHPQPNMKPAICHFINNRLTTETRLIITINGIWENQHQYGISYFLSSM